MKFLQFLIRLTKFTIGLLLIPACYGVTLAFYHGLLGEMRSQYWFLWGFAAFIFIFAIFQQPIRSYVFGHELTHAFWILLFRGDVTAFSASAKGGKVEGTKGNFFIALSPYFFPVYAVLLIAIYFLGRLFWDPQRFMAAYVFLIGFTWSFHIILTTSVLVKGQPDVKKNGYLFSLTIIYVMNVIVLGIILISICPDFGWADLKDALCRYIPESYTRSREALRVMVERFR